MPDPSADSAFSQYFAIDRDNGSQLFVTPEIEECEPLLSDGLLFEDNTALNHSDSTPSAIRSVHPSLTFLEVKPPSNSFRRSSSDHNVHVRIRDQDSPETAFRAGGDRHIARAYRMKDTRNNQSVQTSPRSRLKRTYTSPDLEVKPSRSDPAAGSTRPRQQPTSQTRGSGAPPPLSPWRVRCVRTATAPFPGRDPQVTSTPGFRWFPVHPSLDGSYIPQLERFRTQRGKDLPLKPCMKQKSRSAATTPPHVRIEEFDTESGQNLRRVKTVDFEDAVKKLRSPLTIWGDELDQDCSNQTQRLKMRTDDGISIPRRTKGGVPTCPGPKTKSRPAATAVTRTDVHVVAITPSWSDNDAFDIGGVDSTPTTAQIVESKAGCYEVLWDDRPSEHDIPALQRSASTSISLPTTRSSATTGLERVNSKLTEWSWTKDGTPGPCKLQVVASPETDSRAPQFDCTVDNEDLVIVAPPNSEKTSGSVSRYPSHSTSARVSRTSSSDGLDFETGTVNGYAMKKRESRVVTDSETSKKFGGHRIGVSRGVRRPSTGRRRSSVEDTEIHFRGHRDSMALARSRIANAGGVSEGGIRPELFMHRDSVSMAKKRMQSSNHATTAAYEIPCSKGVASDLMPTIDDSDDSEPVTPKKQTALQGLKYSSSTSMLAPQTETHRHIRILE